jgi:hypothetical protein
MAAAFNPHPLAWGKAQVGRGHIFWEWAPRPLSNINSSAKTGCLGMVTSIPAFPMAGNAEISPPAGYKEYELKGKDVSDIRFSLIGWITEFFSRKCQAD